MIVAVTQTRCLPVLFTSTLLCNYCLFCVTCRDVDITGTTSSFESQPIASLDGPLSFQFNSIAENPFSSSCDNQREDTGGPDSVSEGSDADSDISDDEFNFAHR